MRLQRFNFGLRLLLVIFFGIVTISQLSRWFQIEMFDVTEIPNEQEENPDEKLQADTPSTNRYLKLERFLQDQLVQEKGTGCIMPNLDPFSTVFTKFDKDVPVIDCGDGDWVECNFAQCYIRQAILDQMKNISCTYKDIVYINDDEYYLGKAVTVKSSGKYTLNVTDHVKISCSGIKSEESKQSQWKGRKAGYRPLPVMDTRPNSLNALVLVIDSLSRNAFIRRMPTSNKVLKDELQAVVMNSYNIVGDGTHEAMWPILTGHNQLELSDSTRRPSNKKRVDLQPFIFTLLNKYGYRTAFLEEMPWTGTFNRLYNGFEHMPADHYFRHLTKDIGIWGKQVWSPTQQGCFGSESNFKFLVEYSAKLFEMNTKKFCVSVSASYSHEDINQLTLADVDLAQFLRKFKRDGHLEDTMLFVMGDHGPRNGDIRNTYAGTIDERLPFASIVLPERLKASRPDALSNLIANSDVLTTPFDIHTTILDALELKEHRNKYKIPGADLERGMSFLELIPHSRSCAEAGVIPHYCICSKKWENVPNDDIFYMKVARKLANFVNVITSQQRHKCVKRKLVLIEWVHSLIRINNERSTLSNMYRTGYAYWHRELYQKYYQAKIIMGPTNAIFEGTMSYDFNTDSFNITDSDVSRIDRYGNQPNCVMLTHPHLSKYCFCNST